MVELEVGGKTKKNKPKKGPHFQMEKKNQLTTKECLGYPCLNSKHQKVQLRNLKSYVDYLMSAGFESVELWEIPHSHKID